MKQLLLSIFTLGLLVECQNTSSELAEPDEPVAAPAATEAAVSDSLFLGLIFPHAPPKPSGPVTQAALLMTRQGAPIERVVLGSFDGRATVLDSLAERKFPAGALLGFRTYHLNTGTDVAILRADDTTLHVLSRPVGDTSSALKSFSLLKKVPITAGSHLRVVR